MGTDGSGSQAHRELQRGPGNHFRGALSQFPYVLRARRGEGGYVGMGVPGPHHPTRGHSSRKRVKQSKKT